MSSVGKPTTPAKCFPGRREENINWYPGETNRKRHQTVTSLLVQFLSSVLYHIDDHRDEHSIARAAAPSCSATTAHPRCQSFLEPHHREPKIPRARPAPPIHISDPPAPFTMSIHSFAMRPNSLEPGALAAPHLPRLDCFSGHERSLPSSGRR